MSAPTTPMTSMPPGTFTPAQVPPHITPPAPSADDVPTMPIYRLTVEQYHQMLEAGILKDGDPVELLSGWLVKKRTKYRPHTFATWQMRSALERLGLANYYIDSQEPITLADSEPEPDVSVIRGKLADYKRQPTGSDAPFVVEVADSSLTTDQGAKLKMYARARIAVYWIIDLIHDVVEVYTEPDGATYMSAICYLRGADVPIVVDGREVGRIRVHDLLP